MTNQTRRIGRQARTTLSPGGTVVHTEVPLDHQSSLAIAYARKWLDVGPGRLGVDVRAAGVVRRALQLYMTHLASSALDAAQEGHAVRLCCRQLKPDEETRQAALGRLEAATERAPFPSFTVVLLGEDVAARVARLDAEVQATLDEIATSRWGRMKRLKFDQLTQTTGTPSMPETNT